MSRFLGSHTNSSIGRQSAYNRLRPSRRLLGRPGRCRHDTGHRAADLICAPKFARVPALRREHNIDDAARQVDTDVEARRPMFASDRTAFLSLLNIVESLTYQRLLIGGCHGGKH